jgi:hypothetical protein
MAVEIRPEPTPQEREAILRALAELDGRGEEPSAWWLDGVRESVGEDGELSAGGQTAGRDPFGVSP